LRQEERKRDAFARVYFYILANPARARLIKESEVWPFCGAIVPGYPRLHPLERDFWPKFWRIVQLTRRPDAGERKLPLWSSELRDLDSH
jgi:hypothetical protein